MIHPVNAEQPAETPTRGHLGRLLASTGISVAGQGMVIAAVPLLAASLTRNPLWVSVVAASTYAAWLVVGLPAGALVDRWPRRLTMVVADLVRAGLIVVLAVLVLVDRMSIGALVAIVFLVGVAGCFFDPAGQAAIPGIVGRDPDQLAKANSRLWTFDILGRSLIGPPLGAALFAIAVVLPFGVNALTFVVSAVFLAGLRLSRPARLGDQVGVGRSLAEGVRYLGTHRELRALTLGMGAYNFGYNTAFATFVLFAQERLHIGDRGFGILLGTLAIGGLLGGWAAPKIARRLTARQVYGGALLLQAFGWGAMLVLPTAVVAGVALAVIGLASTVVSVVGGTARQSLSPDELLGRVSATARVVGIGAAALGSLVGGVTASAGWGLSAPLVAAGCICALAGCAFLFTSQAKANGM